MRIENSETFIEFPLMIVNMGVVSDLSENNFTLPNNVPFLIKNETNIEIYTDVIEGVDVTLEVIPAGNRADE